MTTVADTKTTWNIQAAHLTAIDASNHLQWSVLPLNVQKKPPIRWKTYQTTRATEENILAWMAEFQPRAWAVITGSLSGIIVLDFDGEPGRATMELLGLHPHVKTGSGGYHQYFKHPGWHVKTLNHETSKDRPWSKAYPGLDIRADGGYAAFCGSNNKGPYTWLREPFSDELDILSEELRNFLGLLHAPGKPNLQSQRANTTHAPTQSQDLADTILKRALDRAHSDGRNNAGFWLVSQLRDNNFSYTEAESIMHNYVLRVSSTNAKGQHEEYTEQEATNSLKSAYNGYKREPWENRSQRLLREIDTELQTWMGKRQVDAQEQVSDNEIIQEQHEDSSGDVPKEDTLKKLQTLVDVAIEQENISELYDLAEAIGILPLKEQALLSKTIQNKTTKCKDFSWSAFRDLLKAHQKARLADQMRKGSSAAEYEKTDTGMIYSTEAGNPVWISNFTAEIASDVTTDDGAEQTRSYELVADLFNRHFQFEVPAKEFAKCEWVDEHLGAKARITTGQSMKSHLINAIKYCSASEEHFHYAHTGWRKVSDTMVYLHAGGAISQVSQVTSKQNLDLTHRMVSPGSALGVFSQDIHKEVSQVSQVSQEKKEPRVKLTGTLTNYVFPTQRTNAEVAIRASLEILDLASDLITLPLYSALWRSVLGEVNFGIHLAGQTGLGKTELCALIQQHFGAAMDANKLPGSWESTENSLEMLLFQAKDTIVVVDDFKPKGGKVDQDRLHAKADRLFRQLGNGSARGRLTSNLEQRVERRPRCLLISTGEDIPRGQSLKARSIVLSMDESITTGEAGRKLAIAQKQARSGLYAQAMAGFVEWLTPRIEAIQEQLPDLIATEREHLHVDGHARSSTNMANMFLGMRYFLSYACEAGAITQQEAQAYLFRCKAALVQIASEASRENIQDKPSEQWRRLLIAALTSKSAHLVTPTGGNPGLEYGWVQSIRDGIVRDGVFSEEEIFHGGGSQIGWIDGDDVYLSPTAAYKAAKAIGSATGDDITTLEPTLRKFLLQDGVLASTDIDKARRTITVRRRLQSLQVDVLHIKKKYFFPESPLINSPDSHDLPDSEVSRSASDGVLEVSQVDDSKGNESGHVFDSHLTQEKNGNGNGYYQPGQNGSQIGQSMSASHVSNTCQIPHTPLDSQHEEMLKQLQKKLAGWPTVYFSMPGFEVEPSLPLPEYFDRLRGFLYGSPHLVQLAVDEMQERLSR